MTAGTSAGATAHRSSGRAPAGALGARLAELRRLTTVGYVVLEGRSGPGRHAAAVDLVLVGPGGVFLLDAWDVTSPAVTDGRLLSDQDDITEEIYALADLGQVLEADLVQIGVSPNEVHPVVVVDADVALDEVVDSVRIIDGKSVACAILAHGQRWSPDLVEQVVGRCEVLFPVRGSASPGVGRPATSGLATDGTLDVALVESMLASPAEEWMVRLHPTHAPLVRRTFDGPARIHGAAGTGKSTIGLHRAAYLARLNPTGRVLVTSLGDVLPSVLECRFARLAPEAVRRVDFWTVDDLAARILRARDAAVRVDAARAITAFSLAWNRVGRQGALGESGLPATHWQEEVGVVVRGRGLTDLDTYLALDRVGRSLPITEAERRAVWELHRAYADELDAAGVTDWAGLVLQAEDALRERPYGTVPGELRIGSVIVDEAQDLSCSQARLLRAVAGDGPDALLLLDDGRQSIYPGGYSFDEAGIVLGDRSVALRTNFRRDGASADAPDVEPVRWRGAASELPDALVARVQDVVASLGTNYGDVGVLALTTSGVRTAAAALVAAGLPVRRLADPDGGPGVQADAVAVGTVRWARGLEFKHVLLCGFPAESAQPDDRGSGAAAEAGDRARRELLVGSTRARDGLWIATTVAS
ncbi:UvrD-helicase domain-containing protein [Sanguibacter sp. 25GB23B1]|uniref:UvrD-helicase domain-containing protein n=1 Tax=unclassified Sanguibacter TaxID=2645534 RepID=UPI0032AFF223